MHAQRRRLAARIVGCATALAALTIGTPLPQLAAHAAEPTGAVASDAVPGVGVEVPSMRTEYMTTYRNPSGNYTSHISVRPVNYRTPAGWMPIDTTLVPAPGGALSTAANRWSATFRPALAGGLVVTDTAGSITMAPLGAAAALPVRGADGTSVTYANVWPGADLRYRVLSNEVKEEIVLNRRPDRSTFSFATGTPFEADPAQPGGLKPTGALAASWRVPPPVVLDKDRVPVHDTPARFVPTSGVTPRVDVVVDPAWLDGLTAADYPVVVDPTTSTVGTDYSAAFEGAGHIQTCGPTPPCSLRVGEYPPEGWNPWRSVIRFDWTTLFGRSVSNAQINIWGWSGGWSGTYPMSVYRSTGDNWSQFAETLVPPTNGSTSYTLAHQWLTDNLNNYLQQGIEPKFKFIGDESSPSVQSYKAFDSFNMYITWDYVAPSLVGGPSATPSTVYEDQSVTVAQAWTHSYDTARLLVCKAPGATPSGCSNGQWAASGYGSQGTSSAAFVPGHSIGSNTYYTYVCSVGACSNAGSGSFTVLNRAPSAGTITAAPNPVREGTAITWTVPFSDINTGTSRATVCKTATMNGGSCASGQAWAVGSFSGGSPATASYTVPVDSGTGPFTWFAAACDQNNDCSTPQSGTFTVQDVASGGALTVSPNPVPVGSTATFSRTWTSSEGQKLVVCKTNAISNGACTGGTWATGSVTATSPATAAFTATTSDLGSRTGYGFLCTASNACDSGSSVSFLVQDPPTVSGVTDSPDPVDPGTAITFRVTWADSVEPVKAVVCKTNDVASGAGVQASCPGGAWAIGSTAGSANPAVASFTPTTADSGVQSYYAFACTSTANGSACSPVPTPASGTFVVTAVSAATVSVSPATQARTIGDQAAVVVTVHDAAGNPLPNAPLSISRSGANPQAPQSFTTGADGTYTYRYAGTNPGADVVEASAGGSVATATVVWATALPGAYPSDACAASGNVVSGYAGDVYQHVRQDANPANPNERRVCFAVQSGSVHAGGQLVLSAGAGSVGADVEPDLSQAAFNECVQLGDRVNGGTIAGQPWSVYVAPNPNGTLGAWVCVQVGQTYVRLPFTATAAVAANVLPDTTAPHAAYALPALTGQWSATCRANGGTRVVDVLVGTDTPVALYTWSESSSKTHVCFRTGTSGGRLDVDSTVVPAITFGTTRDASTPLELFTLDTPEVTVWSVNPLAPTLPAGVFVGIGDQSQGDNGYRVTVSGGTGSLVTFRQDPA